MTCLDQPHSTVLTTAHPCNQSSILLAIWPHLTLPEKQTDDEIIRTAMQCYTTQQHNAQANTQLITIRTSET